MLTSAVCKSTVISTSNVLAGNYSNGFVNATGVDAYFSSPANMVYDGSHNLYVSDVSNHSIRKITPAGVVSTYAGTGSSGSANGNGTSASFNTPAGLAIDSNSNIYVADLSNNTIRKITTARDVTTVAFKMTGPSQIAVDSLAATMIAIDYLSNIHYYSGVDKGLIYMSTGGTSNVTSVAFRYNVVPDLPGVFYYTPTYDGLTSRPSMVRLEFTGNTASNVKTITSGTDTAHGGGRTTMAFGYTITAGGANDPWGVGIYVTLTSFSGAHAGFNNQSLPITAYNPLGAPPTFSVSILGNFSASNYPADAGPKGTIYQENPTHTPVSVDGSGSSSIVYRQLSFQSATSFCAQKNDTTFIQFTLSGGEACNAATSNAQISVTGTSNYFYAVKSSTPLEVAYDGIIGSNAIYLYAKQY